MRWRAPSIRARRWCAYEQKRLPMTAEIVRSNRRGGPEGVIDAVEQLAPDGFDRCRERAELCPARGDRARLCQQGRLRGCARACSGAGVAICTRHCEERRACSTLEGGRSDPFSSHAAMDRRIARTSTAMMLAHAPGGGGRKWMLYSAAIATTSSGFCSFML